MIRCAASFGVRRFLNNLLKIFTLLFSLIL